MPWRKVQSMRQATSQDRQPKTSQHDRLAEYTYMIPCAVLPAAALISTVLQVCGTEKVKHQVATNFSCTWPLAEFECTHSEVVPCTT